MGLLGIPTGTYNRWWGEIERQRVHRREKERISEKRCVFSTTCRLDRQPSCGQWGECSHRPGSALTQTNDKSAFALYRNNTLPFHSTNRTYHTNHSAHTCICTFPARSVCLSFFPSFFYLPTYSHVHTHISRALTNVGTDAPHQTVVALCSLRTS